MKETVFSIFCQIIVLFVLSQTAFGQPTEFTYQGQLQTGGSPANGNHDFEFALFDAASVGTQLGSTVAANGVAVTNGSFSVRLNFGDQFPGAERFLEIRVRQTGGGALTTLAPRQPITSAPYSVKSLSAATAESSTNATNAVNAQTADNALRLGGLTAELYVLRFDSRLSDARPPLPNSTNYVQNRTTQQSSSNFNISGTGTADIFDAATQFNLGGQRILTRDGSNLFVGISAGSSNPTGTSNSFFGFSAGRSNTTGNNNSFFGSFAGHSNTTGSNLTILGRSANVGSDNLINATAIGFRALVTQSDSLVLGSINGVNGSEADTKVGIGTTEPTAKLTLQGRGAFNQTGAARFDIINTRSATNYLQHVTDSGSWQLATTDGQTRILVDSSGIVSILNLAAETATTLCRNGNQIAACTSSIRYKENLNTFGSGLNLIRRLRPVTFNWKGGETLDLGLIAEEVADVEPLLITRDDKGEIEGVKYDRVGVVLVNAVQEQQTQIETQQKQIDEQKEIIKKQEEKINKQQNEIDGLKKFVCSQNPAAELCRPQN